ncbi:MAG TPA: NYN domain-containing protein [Candidatus Dormibacteraeota bacterium]
MHTLIVDGYNVIHAWPALKRVLDTHGLEDARLQLIHALSEYAAHTGVEVTVVFDAHGRAEPADPADVIDGVTVLFGTTNASADHVIERLAHRSSRNGRAADVIVATGDRLERSIVGAMGVGSIRPEELAAEVARVEGEVARARTQREAGRSQRVEDHLSPETRSKLDAIWTGRSREQAEEAG